MRVAFLTQGCRLNQFETDAVARDFLEAGHERAREAAEAELVVVNTCTVTQAADLDGRRLVRRLVARLGAGRVVVTGCSAQRDPAAYASIPGVRLVAGNSHKSRLLQSLLETEAELERGAGAPVRVAPLAGQPARDRLRSLLTRGMSSHARAYLRVQDGCNQSCTFCTLPSVRGSSASLPLGDVTREAGALAAAGHGEIVLTGAHLGSYGTDLAPRVPLARLVAAVLDAAPACRVRLSSLEPRFVSAELTALLATEPRLCPHLHLPLQSGDDAVLGRMRRAYRAAAFERRALAAARAVNEAAERAPGLALGSDFLVGFPGESDRAFAATVELVDRLPFTYGHVFSYSPRPGTPAAGFADGVARDTIQRRAAVLRELLERKAVEFRMAHIGQEVEIVAERVEPPAGAREAEGARVLGTSERFLAVAARPSGRLPERGTRLRVLVTGVENDILIGHEPAAPSKVEAFRRR